MLVQGKGHITKKRMQPLTRWNCLQRIQGEWGARKTVIVN